MTPEQTLIAMRHRAEMKGISADDPYMKFLETASQTMKESDRRFARQMAMVYTLTFLIPSAIGALVYLALQWLFDLFQ